MKTFLIRTLQTRAKKVLATHKPKVVAITGSIGKTSAKQAIIAALGSEASVRTGLKNYNNEIGVPLAILGEKSPGKSLFGWVRLLLRSYRVKTYPEVLVLEFGIDHPGDMKALCDIATPDIAVVTGISPVHAEYFANIDALASEKSELVASVAASGTVVLNGDDERVRSMQERSKAPVVFYGTSGEGIVASNIRLATRRDDSFEPGETFAVTRADVAIDSSELGELRLQNAIGYAPVMACLAGIAVARVLGVNPTEAMNRLSATFVPVAGRLRPLAGIKGTLLIDDSYNAAPAAMKNGLDILRQFTPGEEWDRRIAVLGEMRELGTYSEDEHRLIGMKAAEVADLFVAVGEGMRPAVAAAVEAGIDKEHVEWFKNSEEAGRYLDRVVEQGDVIYIKGSQFSRMEKVTKDLMAEPLRAPELLVRQEEAWLKE